MGSVIGASIGGPTGGRLGFAAGVLVAGALFPPKAQRQSHGKLDDLKISGSAYSSMIVQCYGLARVGGLLVWVEKDENGNHLRESSRAIRASKGGSREVGRKYSYSCTMAWVVCRGPIAQIKRIIAEDKVIYDAAASPTGPTKYAPTIYLGTETQTVDPDIEAAEGIGNWTAYRGLAYVVFDDFPLDEWGGRIPNMNFEVAGIGGAADATPLAWYRFEDSPGLLQDSGPNGYHLTETLGGTATQTTGPTSFGEGLRFAAGTGQYLRRVTGNLPAWHGTQLTVDFWARYNGPGSSAVHFTYWDESLFDPEYPFFITIDTTFSGSIDVSFATTAGAAVPVSIIFEPFSLDGNWHRVTWTYDGGGLTKLYLDTVEVASTAAPYASLAINATAAAKIEFSQGKFDLDEVTVYNAVVPPSDDPGAGVVTVDVILADLFAQVGLDAGEYDVTAAAAKSVTGFVIGSRVDVRQAIRELLMVTDLDLAEIDGKIKVVARGGASVVTIPAADLGAHVSEGGDEGQPPPLVAWKRLPGSELPYRLDLEYLSVLLDYQQGQATAVRFARVSETQEQLTVSTPLVLTEAQARQAAEKLLYQQWWERSQGSVSLGPKYAYLAPADIVTVPVAGALMRTRIEQMDWDVAGCIRLSLIADAAEILTQFAEGPVLEAPFPGLTESSTTLAVVWSGTAIIDANALDGKVGVYVAAGGPLGEDWPGAVIYWSRDGGTTYEELETAGDNASLGSAATVLAAPPGGAYDLFDAVSTVDITLTSGDAPESSSDDAVLNGANGAILGDEIIQFVNVLSLGSNQYRLSRLLRGRRGTESYGGSHVLSERFALLEDGRIARAVMGREVIGATIFIKVVTSGTTVAATSPVSLTLTGNELKPYSPAHVTGTRNMSLDVQIAWVRRARAGGEWADLQDVGQPEAILAYEIDVLTAPAGAVLRTLSASTETVAYVVADQISDFGSAQASIAVVAYQLGALGRGFGTAATV